MLLNIQRNHDQYYAVYQGETTTNLRTYRKTRSWQSAYSYLEVRTDYTPRPISEAVAQRFFRMLWQAGRITKEDISRYDKDDNGKCIKWTARIQRRAS